MTAPIDRDEIIRALRLWLESRPEETFEQGADRILALVVPDPRIARIEALHIKVDVAAPWCAEDGHGWPCRTIRKLRGDA